jgi:hypothetical protein
VAKPRVMRCWMIFSNITTATLCFPFLRKRSGNQEKQAEHERHLREAAGVYHIFAGLPETVTFFEACQVKAAQGDALAQ